MNTRDYTVRDMPADRLSFVKTAIRKILPEFPCGSEFGLGIFTNQETLVLFEPIEICSNYSILDDTLSHIDWRMAWAGDSNVRRGLYRALITTSKLDKNPHLIFISDGESTIDDDYPAPIEKLAGKTDGIIIGVGGLTSVRTPKLDQDNIVTGYWMRDEISKFQITSNTNGQDSNFYRSNVDETNLKQLARLANLRYTRLESSENLKKTLLSDEFASPQPVDFDMRWLCGLTALLLLLTTLIRVSPRAG